MIPEEEQLVLACRNHDQEACRQLYDKFAPAMLGVCMRYTNDRDAAQDILHDGFIKVFANLKHLRTPESLSSWIKSIMVNTALDTVRKVIDTVPIDNYASDQNYTTDMQEFDNIDTDVIVDALQRLPKMLRFAFNLCEIEGYSEKEAAEYLKVQPVTVRTYCCRAKQALQKMLLE